MLLTRQNYNFCLSIFTVYNIILGNIATIALRSGLVPVTVIYTFMPVSLSLN